MMGKGESLGAWGGVVIFGADGDETVGGVQPLLVSMQLLLALISMVM